MVRIRPHIDACSFKSKTFSSFWVSLQKQETKRWRGNKNLKTRNIFFMNVNVDIKCIFAHFIYSDGANLVKEKFSWRNIPIEVYSFIHWCEFCVHFIHLSLFFKDRGRNPPPPISSCSVESMRECFLSRLVPSSPVFHFPVTAPLLLAGGCSFFWVSHRLMGGGGGRSGGGCRVGERHTHLNFGLAHSVFPLKLSPKC